MEGMRWKCLTFIRHSIPHKMFKRLHFDTNAGRISYTVNPDCSKSIWGQVLYLISKLLPPMLKSVPDCLIPTPPLILTPPPLLILNLPMLGG